MRTNPQNAAPLDAPRRVPNAAHGLPLMDSMVAAVLAGRKTQTRRVITSERGPYPNARVGDTFWVREAHKMDVYAPGSAVVICRERSGCHIYGVCWPYIEGKPIMYPKPADPKRWRPPMFMFRWASRIDLRITGIRDEPLRNISEADAIAEGLQRVTKDGKLYKYGIPDRDGLPGSDDHGWPWQQWENCPRAAFRKLWDSINAKRGYSWDENPPVRVFEFEVIKP